MSYNVPLDNRSPFAASKLVLPDPEGQEAVLVVAAATFDVNADGTLDLSEEQQPIRLADIYTEEQRPGRSSVRYEAEIALTKPRVDVLIAGHAHAPRDRAVPELLTELCLGDIRKQVIVTGDREWTGFGLSSPRPFSSMPIGYERAFGGCVFGDANVEIDADPRNPVGMGFKGARSADPTVASQVPNFEYPASRMRSPSDSIAPAGFGPLGRGWQPRVRYAGSFDQDWLDTRWPFLPRNFDSLHYQCAPEDQQMASLRGGEGIRLVNFTTEGVWQFRLPSIQLPVLLLYGDRAEQRRLNVDTVLLEPDSKRVRVTSRLPVHGGRGPNALREIVLGGRTPGYVRARLKGKRYIDRPQAVLRADATRFFSV